MRPHIFVTAEKVPELRSLGELREALDGGRSAELWRALLAKADRESAEAPWTPASPLPGRRPGDLRHANREHTLVGLTASRILDAAFAAMVLDERRYAEAALAQIDALFDEDQWPEIEDLSHLRSGDHCSLRRGQLAFGLGTAYDWMYGLLTGAERARLIERFDERFTRAFKAALAAHDRWVDGTNNFVTAIYGGFGIAGMGFGADYAEAAQLAETCTPAMERYLGGLFGAEGEFNESVQYSGSAGGIVQYLMAMHYHCGGADGPFDRYPLQAFCRWYMHQTFPPGRVAGFGDPAPDMPPVVAPLAAVAAATRNGVIQWFYLQYAERMLATHRKRSLELLAYDPTLPPEPPDGKLPLGAAYHEQGKLVSSRSSWDPSSCTSVVYGKAGREGSHGHPDWGQVCIDGHGERLIVDLGSTPGYPRGPKDPYYNYQQLGHNVLVLGESETGGVPCGLHATRERKYPQGRFVSTAFDDARGGTWTMDLAEPYGDAAESIRRTVAHLLPDVAVVLDDAELTAPQLIRLRWHTISPAKCDAEGNFAVRGEAASLAGRISRLDGSAELTAGRHEYTPPYHTDRLGEPYPQRHEPYVELRARDRRCRILTLFAVFGPGETPRAWQQVDGGWRIGTPAGTVIVSLTDEELLVAREGGAAWRVRI